MGELLALYAIADVAFVGGSLIPHGGQNMLEPAALAKPVLFGQHTGNFIDISEQLIDGGGARRVSDADALYMALEQLFTDAELRAQMGRSAAEAIQRNRGALKALFVLLSPVLINAAAARSAPAASHP
jgi:3-deoxy-D-manno-octulosonic-acid transferase